MDTSNQELMRYYKRGKLMAEYEMQKQSQDQQRQADEEANRQAKIATNNAIKAKQAQMHAEYIASLSKSDKEQRMKDWQLAMHLAEIRRKYLRQAYDTANTTYNNSVQTLLALRRKARIYLKNQQTLSPSFAYDIQKLANGRFSNFEYYQQQGKTNQSLHDTIQDVQAGKLHLNPSVCKFPSMSRQKLNTYARLLAVGEQNQNNNELIHKMQIKLEDHISAHDGFNNLDKNMRQKVDFLEHYGQRQNIDPDIAQSAISDPVAWSKAASELQLKIYNNAAKDKDGNIIGEDIPLIYRYFAVQEAFSKCIPNWQKYAKQADQELITQYGATPIYTAKAISSDYLQYLQNLNKLGDMKPFERYNQKIAGYPENGLLNTYPLNLDPNKTARTNYLKMTDSDNFSSIQQMRDELWDHEVLARQNALARHSIAVDYNKNEAYIKFIQDPDNDFDYKHFDYNWKQVHNGLPEDLAKVHPETQMEYTKPDHSLKHLLAKRYNADKHNLAHLLHLDLDNQNDIADVQSEGEDTNGLSHF